MKQIYNKISPLIESQIPSFYREEGPFFVAFVQEYYRWLESTNNPLYYSRNLLSFRDIDSTLDEFLPHFQHKYLQDVSILNVADKRELVKHALEIYRSKGTIHSLRLMFRLLFREEIDVYYPGDDILRTSDGIWVMPSFLEVTVTDRSKSFVNKTVYGSISGAYGFVESVVRKTNKGKTIDVLYLSNVRGDFITGELVNDDGIALNSPTIIGSLSKLLIDTAGSGFEVGQIVDVLSQRSGERAKARIIETGTRTGEVNYRLTDGGFGYTLNANVFGTTQKIFVSANVLSLSTFIKTDPYSQGFAEESTIRQPLVNVSFDYATANLTSNTIVYGSDGLGNTAAGFILNANQSGNTGWVLVSPRTVTTLDISSIQNANNVTGSYEVDEVVYQNVAVGQVPLGTIITANATAIVVDRGPDTDPVDTTIAVIGQTSNCVANVSVSNNINFSTSSFEWTGSLSANGVTANVVTFNNITPSTSVIGSNAVAVGITTPTSGAFTSLFRNYVYSTSTNEYARVINISSGNPGGVKLGAIADRETVYLNTDRLQDYNSSNVAYVNVSLSNTSGYGFPLMPTANLNTVIGAALTQKAFTIGSISTLTERDPGVNNTSRPFIMEKEYIVAGFGKKEEQILLASYMNDRRFVDGEYVQQFNSDPAMYITITGVNGQYNTTDRELVYQVQASGNVVYGEIYTASLVSGAGNLRVRVANVNQSFDTSNVITGVWSGAAGSPTNVSISNLSIQAVGQVIESNTTSVTIKKRSFFDFNTGTIEGSTSGAIANVTYVSSVDTSSVIGNNAIVDAAAGISNGTIVAVEVADSGNFYEEGESVELYAANNQIVGKATVVLGKQGIAQGYWRNTRGFLDSNKYIQDNDYYQEYSYEIQSGVNKSTYEKIIKETIHMAGTKMFGRFDKKTIASAAINVADVTYNRLVFLELDQVGTIQVGERIVQGSNTASGTVVSIDAAINTISVTGVEGHFTVNTNITSITSNNTATILSTNIQLL